MEIQVNKDHYSFSHYITKTRWMSYYYQLQLIYDLNPKTILEIGVGNNFLKKQISNDFDIITLDVDESLHPDVIGNVISIPLLDNSFDLVVCFQLLEHLPFGEFEKALKELSRISKKNVIISLPYAHHGLIFQAKIFKKLKIESSLVIPQFYRRHLFDGQHYWEIGKKDYPKGRVEKILGKYFMIRKIIHPSENKYHIFFLLEKV